MCDEDTLFTNATKDKSRKSNRDPHTVLCQIQEQYL